MTTLEAIKLEYHKTTLLLGEKVAQLHALEDDIKKLVVDVKNLVTEFNKQSADKAETKENPSGEKTDSTTNS
jgi:hypothetical protein